MCYGYYCKTETIIVIGGIVTLVNGSIIPLAVGIIVAEIGGVLEELVDQR